VDPWRLFLAVITVVGKGGGNKTLGFGVDLARKGGREGESKEGLMIPLITQALSPFLFIAEPCIKASFYSPSLPPSSLATHLLPLPLQSPPLSIPHHVCRVQLDG